MLPILFTIPKIGNFGPFPVHSFGVIMVIAFVAALWLARRRAPKFGIDPNKVSDAGFWAIVAGILGARVVFIAQEWPYYSAHLDQLFSLQFSGLTSFGGLIFAIVALVFWARKQQIPVPRVFDLLAPAFLLGHIIGRFGCLLNGCCFGGVCDPHFFLATSFQGVPGLHHPAQMYDALMNLMALGGLLLLERRGLRMGQSAGFAVFGYGLARFIYEFWRAGTEEQVRQNLASSTTIGSLPITQAQVMALALVIVGAVWMVIARRNQPEFGPQPEPEPLAAPDQELLPA